MFRCVPCIPDLSKTFIMQMCSILSKAFPTSNEMIIQGFIFQFLYMVYYIDRFSYVEPSLHLWNETYSIKVDDFFDVVLDLVCEYFIEYFCITVHEGN